MQYIRTVLAIMIISHITLRAQNLVWQKRYSKTVAVINADSLSSNSNVLVGNFAETGLILGDSLYIIATESGRINDKAKLPSLESSLKYSSSIYADWTVIRNMTSSNNSFALLVRYYDLNDIRVVEIYQNGKKIFSKPTYYSHVFRINNSLYLLNFSDTDSTAQLYEIRSDLPNNELSIKSLLGKSVKITQNNSEVIIDFPEIHNSAVWGVYNLKGELIAKGMTEKNGEIRISKQQLPFGQSVFVTNDMAIAVTKY